MDNKKGIKPSICLICLGLVLTIAGLCSWFLVSGKEKSNTESSNTENIGPKDHDGTRVLKNGKVNGYSLFNGEGILYVDVDGQEIELKFKGENFLQTLGSYGDYVRVNITYNESGNDKYLGSYELVNAKTGDLITGVSDEHELRTRLGLLNEGTYTEISTLKTPLDNQGIGIDDIGTYTFFELTFERENGEEFRVSLRVREDDTKDYSYLQVGNKYNLTYEMKSDEFGDYDCIFIDATPVE